MRFFKVVDYAVPDQVGHDGRERAVYAERLNVQVLTLSLSSGVNKHTLAVIPPMQSGESHNEVL